MKYNKGDKVIKLNLDYFDNPFHYEKTAISYTVKDCSEKHFTVFGSKLKDPFWGANKGITMYQDSGQSCDFKDQYYHAEKDREQIIDLIKKAEHAYNEKCAKNDNDRIEELENIIIKAKDEIQEIKNGNGKWKLGFSLYSNKEYKEKVLAKITSVFQLSSNSDYVK